jgi:hypothetical protein
MASLQHLAGAPSSDRQPFCLVRHDSSKGHHAQGGGMAILVGDARRSGSFWVAPNVVKRGDSLLAWTVCGN